MKVEVNIMGTALAIVGIIYAVYKICERQAGKQMLMMEKNLMSMQCFVIVVLKCLAAE